MLLDKPLISVIIPNYNGEDVIKECLESVISEAKDVNYEIIVVDNNSLDKSIEIINEVSSKNSKLKLLRLNRNLGFSGACYKGYKFSKGDFIMLLSNDTKVTRNWFTGLMNKLENSKGKIGAVQSKLILMEYPNRIDSVGHIVDRLLFLRPKGYLESDFGQYDHENEICVLQVVSCLLRREVINEVGGLFDPIYFIIHEDTDLSVRLLLRGYKIMLAPESVVYHKRSWTLGKFPPELIVYLTRRNALMTIIRNYQFDHMLIYGCLSVLVYIQILVWYLATDQSSYALAIIKALLWNIKNFRKIAAKRAFIQQNVRRVNDSEVFRLFDPISFSRLIKFRKYGPLLSIHKKKEKKSLISTGNAKS
jgi:GT2 family glycosyltransferase